MNKLKARPDLINSKAKNQYNQLSELLNALAQKTISLELQSAIDEELDQLNLLPDTDKLLHRKIKDKENRIVRLVEKKQKLVPRNHYKKLWTALGMTAFGLPFGVVFGKLLGNIGLMAIGMPIGMAIGGFWGTEMDKKAVKENRQLDFESKY